MKIKRNSICLGLMLIISVSCAQQDKTFDGQITISGNLDNHPEGYVVLSQYKDNAKEVIDTLDVGDNGKFEYKLSLDSPGFYDLNLMNQEEIRLALYDENVKVKYDFSKDEKPSITGSTDTEQLKKVDKLAADYQEDINKLN